MLLSLFHRLLHSAGSQPTCSSTSAAALPPPVLACSSLIPPNVVINRISVRTVWPQKNRQFPGRQSSPLFGVHDTLVRRPADRRRLRQRRFAWLAITPSSATCLINRYRSFYTRFPKTICVHPLTPS